jgi:hypothetical protein
LRRHIIATYILYAAVHLAAGGAIFAALVAAIEWLNTTRR